MLLDGINRQEYVSDRIPMPVDMVADTAYINSITGETVQLYYFSNAYLTCGTAGETTAATWAALTSTTKFEIDILGKTYVVNPDFTGDASMDNVAASIQTAIRAVTGRLETCTQAVNVITITVAKDESGEGMGNSISVLRNTDSNTGVNIAGASWMNGLYGTGVITPATATTDLGQAAGTLVVAKLAYTGVLDHIGAMIGNEKDTSLTWMTNTALPKKYIKPFPKASVERLTNKEIVDIVYEFGKTLTTNGEWGLDHRTGLIVGRKATTGTSDTAAYKVQTQATGSGTSIAASVNLEKINNVDIPLDDAAFTPGTSPVMPVGYFADETATDSVTEGDIGAPRMTLNRRPINAGNLLDDSAFGVGTDYVSPIGCIADEVGTDSVDEGDVGLPRMTTDRMQIIKDGAVYQAATTANKVVEQTPLSDHVIADTPTILTNIATNTTGYIYIDMDTYRGGSLQIITSGTTPTDTLTLTVEITNQDDGTAQASCTYSPASLEILGVASIVDVDLESGASFPIFLDTFVVCKYLRIKYVTSNDSGADCDLTVYPRKAY